MRDHETCMHASISTSCSHYLYFLTEKRLKLVLAEVLRDLRKSDKCYIKYELKQGCFHITAR